MTKHSIFDSIFGRKRLFLRFFIRKKKRYAIDFYSGSFGRIDAPVWEANSDRCDSAFSQ